MEFDEFDQEITRARRVVSYHEKLIEPMMRFYTRHQRHTRHGHEDVQNALCLLLSGFIMGYFSDEWKDLDGVKEGASSTLNLFKGCPGFEGLEDTDLRDAILETVVWNASSGFAVALLHPEVVVDITKTLEQDIREAFAEYEEQMIREAAEAIVAQQKGLHS